MSIVRLLLLCYLVLFVLPAPASDWIKPGEAVSLGADEGLAVFTVDSDIDIDTIELDRLDKSFSFPRLRRLGAGRHLRVLELPAGEYRMNRTIITGAYWKLDKMPNASFRIEAGKLNYVGELRLRTFFGLHRMMVRNQGLAALAWLDKEHPGLAGRWPWRLANAFPDPFVRQHVERLRDSAQAATVAALADAAATAAAKKPWFDPRLPAASAKQQDWASKLFTAAPVEDVQLSPDGEYAMVFRQVDGKHQIDAVALAAEKGFMLYRGDWPVIDHEWIAPRALVLTWRHPRKGPMSTRVLLRADHSGGDSEQITDYGYVLSVDPARDGRVIYARLTGDPDDQIQLFDLNLLEPLHRRIFSQVGDQRMRDITGDYRWVADAQGRPRIVEYHDHRNRRTLGWFPPGATEAEQMQDVATPEREEESFSILGFDAEGQALALTDHDREHVELVRFDPATGKLGETVYRKAGTDLQSAVYGAGNLVVGVRYIERGRLRQHLFGAGDERLQRALLRALPGQRLELRAATANGNRLVYAEGSANAGRWYVHNATTRQLREIASARPALDTATLAGSERLLVKAADGFEIEAFLTQLPPVAGQKQPLLVMPHGGPIGGFDLDQFDAEVQYFAQLGYAVLRVNFRGSGHRGQAVRKLGFKEWGRGIESDIQAVVDVVLKRPELDPRRVVALGSSYGGYSATVLATNHPERYRAAVAIAAPTDLLLLFTGGDGADSPEARDGMVQMLGDPRVDADARALRERSPAWHPEALKRPLLLVNDRGDERVPIEHALRMRLHMQLVRGVNLPYIETADDTHGLTEPESAIATWPRIAAFLDQALAGEGPWERELADAIAAAKP